jgi:2-dehydro-3-deoxyglucarate aldolase/4-hydroxy-2-oxoheptanedioate aldolase
VVSGGVPAERRLPIGFWLMTANAYACEIGAEVGYDFVVLDLEHGTFNPESADQIIALARARGLAVYSRVSGAERVPIQQALDAGADVVIVPQVRHLEHARQATACAKYPPLGTRGIGHSRINRYGGFSPDFLEAENRRTRCIVMIETQEAFDDVERIAALPTVDGVFIGPGDLSLTRGRGLNRDTPADTADHRRIVEAARKAGKPWSMAAGHPRRRRFAADLGAEFVTTTDDLSAIRDGLAADLALPY